MCWWWMEAWASPGPMRAQAGHTLALVVLHGTVLVNGVEVARAGADQASRFRSSRRLRAWSR